MAKAKTIIKRRKSVQNTMKITRTMEMISTANFKKAGNRAAAFRPYAKSISRLVANVSRAAGDDLDHPLLKTPEAGSAPEAFLIITSNRGLCGGYNTNVISKALAHVGESGIENVSIYASGKKAINLLRFKKIPVEESFTHIDYIPQWDEINNLATRYLDLFERGEISGLSVIYTHFKSASTQYVVRDVMLPLAGEAEDDGEETPNVNEDYIFMPEPEEILEELIPLSFKIKLFSCFLDAGASEQMARMRAMRSATDAAVKMIKYLTQQYNRARQTQITMELLDIIGGSQGMKK